MPPSSPVALSVTQACSQAALSAPPKPISRHNRGRIPAIEYLCYEAFALRHLASPVVGGIPERAAKRPDEVVELYLVDAKGHCGSVAGTALLVELHFGFRIITSHLV
jgi:hypothetical protein